MHRVAFTVFASLCCVAGCASGCTPAYVDTYEPKESSFDVSCSADCGAQAGALGPEIVVSFDKNARRFALCCDHAPEVVAQFQTVRDFWCDGLDVPDRTFGDLRVGTTVSEITQKRGMTLDQGDGYVSFQCGDWLEQLIEKTTAANCCPAKAAAPPKAATGPEAAAP
jgi:hypothetical protein